MTGFSIIHPINKIIILLLPDIERIFKSVLLFMLLPLYAYLNEYKLYVVLHCI